MSVGEEHKGEATTKVARGMAQAQLAEAIGRPRDYATTSGIRAVRKPSCSSPSPRGARRVLNALKDYGVRTAGDLVMSLLVRLGLLRHRARSQTASLS